MRSSLVNARLVFVGSSSALTRTFCDGLEKRGLVGHLAATLFRAQKASTRAKKYGPTKYRGMSYGRKEDMLQRLCKLLAQTDWPWGWGKDMGMPQAPHVLYIELPQGQVSFHCAERFEGPDYGKEWDGQRLSEARILEFADAIAAGQFTLETANALALREAIRPQPKAVSENATQLSLWQVS